MAIEDKQSQATVWSGLLGLGVSALVAFVLGANLQRFKYSDESQVSSQPRPVGGAQTKGDRGIGGQRRITRHTFALRPRPPACENPLPLQLSVAPPPSRCNASPAGPEGPSSDSGAESQPPIVVYVLDPEPMLFGAAALFAYGQAPYGTPGTAEAAYRRMYIIGVGHSDAAFSLDGDGFDPVSLRNIRRRDFPPRDHPMYSEGRNRNAHAERFVDGLVEEVIPHVEGNLLGLSTPPRRAILGASYSAVAALQAMLRHPSAFVDFILGSPSVFWDPEVFNDINGGSFAKAAQEAGAGALILLGEKERMGEAWPGNVVFGDRRIPTLPAGAEMLASALRTRGLEVDGVHDVKDEDHSTVKLSLVSRGLAWVAERSVHCQRTP